MGTIHGPKVGSRHFSDMPSGLTEPEMVSIHS